MLSLAMELLCPKRIKARLSSFSIFVHLALLWTGIVSSFPTQVPNYFSKITSGCSGEIWDLMVTS